MTVRTLRISIVSLVLAYAVVVWSGCATVPKESNIDSMVELYTQTLMAREMVMAAGIDEQDRALFDEAESDYERGVALYKPTDTKAMEPLSSALEKYQRLLANSNPLRDAAQQEYDRAVRRMGQVRQSATELSAALIRDGVVPVGGERSLEGLLPDEEQMNKQEGENDHETN